MSDDEEERAAIREYDGGFSRRNAEAAAAHEARKADPIERVRLRQLQILLGIKAIECPRGIDGRDGAGLQATLSDDPG
jgi:hypothetical protein